MHEKVVIIGPAYPLRGGGLASFNERLARQFQTQGHPTSIYTFSLQYPGFLFPGKSQYSTEPPPSDLKINVRINSINPFNWISTGRELSRIKPDLVVIRYWLPFMGPCLGTILRFVRRNNHTRIICIADNVIPHEKRPGDSLFTKYFVQPVHAFITMSETVLQDLKKFTNSPVRQVIHPLYDNFGQGISKAEARSYLNLPLQKKIILFFGFIRHYKGLDLLLRAMKILKEKGHDVHLLIAGEFYEDRRVYDELIEELEIKDRLFLHTEFIADKEVHYYLSAADFVVQPYRNATQSGVTPLAYHFEKPMLVTRVGGLPDSVVDGFSGLVAEPNPNSIAMKIEELYQLGENHFLPHLCEEKKKYSWSVLTETILELSRKKS
jgi:glycosyltransferase involved in cell wall biosynthesis